MDYEKYWDMTYGEILLHIKAYNRRKTEEMKTQASLNHLLGDLIGASVARLLSKDAKYPTLFETYPGLFEEEARREEELRQEKEWQLYKARIMEYSMANNAKRQAMKEGEDH